MNRTRVLLAEDHADVAEQLRGVLASEFEVVGTVGDGQCLVEAADTLNPDVIVTDIAMPGLDGIAAARVIRERHPDARIVLVTVHDDRALVQQGFAVGVLGYVLKLAAGDDLLPAVHAAVAGKRFVSQGVVS